MLPVDEFVDEGAAFLVVDELCLSMRMVLVVSS